MENKKQFRLSEGHWVFEEFTQRCTKEEWKQVLLNSDDIIFFRGVGTKLKARNLGAGIYEIYKNLSKKV